MQRLQSLPRIELLHHPFTQPEITYKTYVGKVPTELLGPISSLRMRCFRTYPHLYDGDDDNEYEKQCAEELQRSNHTILVTAYARRQLVGFTTAFPLESAAEILDGDSTFAQCGYQPYDFYYWSEAAIAPAYRGHSILTRFCERVEHLARSWGYNNMCLATIVRDENDPRRPPEYRDPGPLWRRFGYTKTNIKFAYHWPTRQVDGSVRFTANEMVLWIKEGLQSRKQA